MGFDSEYLALREKRKKKEEEQLKKTNKTNKTTNKATNKPYAQKLINSQDIAPVIKTLAPDIRTQKTTVSAPTVTTTKKKKKDDRTWFQTGAFDDGYDFGDVTKTILGSVTDIGENLGTSILGMGEKIADAFAMMGTAMGNAQMSQLSNDELAFSALKNIGKDKKTKNEEAESIIKKYDTAQKEAKKGATEFVKKDLYDEEKIAKKIISAPVKNLTGIDAEADSVFGEKSDALIQSGGQLLATAGLNAMGVPWFLTTGLTSFGAEAENALNQGATFEQASMSAAISSGAEILTEKLSGGIKFGGKTLDDRLIKPLTERISNDVLKSLANLGIDAIGEGGEEFISDIFSNLGSALYKEEDLKDILFSKEAWEEYKESFIGGAVLGGAGSVVQTVANRNRIELTENEQKVFDKVVEDRIAEEKAKGTITEKKENEIRKSVLNDMLKGYIDTDTVESVLGGETYKAYKDTVDNETALQKEFDTLNKMKQGEMTGEQLDRRAELKQQLEELKNNSKTSEMKSKLSENVYNLVKDSRLAESYNETARRGQTFQADLSRYNTKQQETIKKAIESGILNNTNRTHEFVDMIAKISADKGVPFDFVNNEKIKASGFAVEGKTVNGYKTDEGSIAINIQSSKSLDSVVGHEITHILEGTELYAELQNAIEEYATTKGEYETRMQSLREVYADVYKGEDFDAKIKAELTADIVGEYLFTDTDFINRLSTEKPNVFKKIYDEIKYLCKIATAGSKEARELERVKRAFEKAYREGANAEGGTKYSISETTDGRIVAVVDSDILNEIDTTSWDNAKKEAAKKAASNALKQFSNGIVVDGITRKVNRTSRKEYTRSQYTESLYNNSPDVFADKMRAADVADDIVVATTNWNRDGGLKHQRDDNFVDFDHGTTLIICGDTKYSAEVVVGITAKGEAVFYDVVDMTPTDFDIKNVESPTTATTQNAIGSINGDSTAPILPQNPKKSSDTQYSLSAEQETYFKDSKVRDENGNLKVMYHGTSKGGHTVFDTYGSNYGLMGTGSYFTDNKSVAESYTNKGKGNNKQVYESYLNITNPLDMDAQGNAEEWAKAFPDVDFPESGTNEQFYRAVEEFYSDQMMPKWEVAEEIRDAIQFNMGYDGITHIGGGRFNKNDDTRHQVYIAFEPEQIKNIENIAPTKDADIRYSLTEDSEGNKLSEKQSEYFANSKAVDRNGNLLKVYHTTKNDFTVFDKARKGEATEDANTYLGFFFTDDAEYMQNFPEFENGKTESYYLDMKNPIDMTNISREAFMDIVEVMGGDVGDASILFDEELEAAHNRAKVRGDNNVSLQLGNLLDELTGEFYYQDFITELKPHYDELMSKGYDGVINYMDELFGVKEYIVLDSHQAKLTSNKNPTADADVRYSLSDSEQSSNDVKIFDGGSVVKYSLSTWTPETQANVKTNLIKSGYTEDRVDKWIQDINGVASVIAANKDRLDFVAADNQTMLKDNQEYIKTLDASTLCAKRLVYQGTFDAIQHRLPNTMLSSDDLIDLLNMMKEHKVQTPCGVCYVESRRRHLGKFAQEWLDGYKGEYKPNLDEVTTSDGLEALRKSHPDTYEDFIAAMKKKGSANPKVVQLRTEYRNEIMSLTPAQMRKIESIGGLRVQSFSDFETPHLLDMMQAVMDMSAKGLSSQAYTKVPNFAWVFGDTGIKINLSLIAEGDGFDADGNLTFSSVEGMDFDEAMRLRDAYSQNVGTIIVGANDKHILACMADDRIDFIIPFHRSGWGMKELDMMGMSSYTDYTYGQKEHDLETGKGLTNLYPPDYWDYTLSGKENAERYLNLCAKTGREPKFSQFLVNNGDGSYSLQPDGSTDGYWKTLIDFKMYDNEGNGAAQQKVQPNFNMAEAYRVLNEYEGGANSLPVANEVVEEFVEKYKSRTSYSLSGEGKIFKDNGRFYGKDIMYQGEDIAPIEKTQATVSKTEQVEDVAPSVVEEIAPTEEVEEAETKPTRRSELHSNIMEGIKGKFAEKGFDFDEVLNNAKNLSTFSTVDNIPQRVMEKALGYKQGQVLADETVNKVAQNESEGIKWLNSFTDRKNGILAQISRQYNIKPGSKKSAAAQMYAEGFYVNKNNEIIKYGDRELAIDFPDVKVQENIKGLANDPRIRQIYDETLEAINESRRRNLYPEIQRLDNYFLHFRAMEDTFSRLGLPFNPNDIRAKDLPTDLNGVTADLKPGQPFFASAMHREGIRTSFDLLGGLERYLSSAKNQIYHIDDIQTLRALRNYIADTYGQAKGLESLDELTDEEAQYRIEQVYNSHLSTFAKFLNEEANVLAGKTTLIDRGIEGVIGRRGITFLNTINGQVGSNMVGFNVSSSLTNILPFVQTMAKTNKFDFVKALAQTSADKINSLYGKSDGFKENSPVIIRRKGADRFYRTPFQKVGDTGYILMSAVDDVTTEIIARTKYNELTRKGMDSQQAHFETDKWVSRLMGDRSLGQMPQLYNSKMLGIVTKFQLEVRNQLDSQFYDTVQEAKVSNEEIESNLLRNAKTAAKVGSTFFQLAVLQHVFGKAFESVAGYNPAFDIIEVLIKTLGFDDDEEDEDTVLDNIEEGFLALLEDLPYTSTFTGGRIPISSALPISELIKGKDQYGNEKSRWDTVKEAAPYYLLPTGYGQLKKTAQGLGMFSDEHPTAGSYTDSGNLRFPVDDTLKNRVQAGVFGQWANDNARTYFDEGYAPLKEKQIQEYIDVEMPIKDYWQYREDLKGLDTLEKKFDFIADMDLPVEKKNILINNIVDRKDKVDLENYDDFENYEEFDFYAKNTEKYNFLQDNGVSYKEYKSSEDAKENYDAVYSWWKNNPEKVTVSKAVTDNVIEYRGYASDLDDIRADKDSNGKSIVGSAKEKKKAYIWNLDIDEGAKYILFKNEYNADDTYNYDIIDYLNSRDDISYDEMNTICEELGFKVNRDTGSISWD